MIFVDSNLFVYAVGRPHPLQTEARQFFSESMRKKLLVTSAEVLQEILHVYLPVRRYGTLDAALELVTLVVDQVLPITSDMVLHGRNLANTFPDLTARDLLHLSVCQLHKIREIKTFDRNLMAAFQRI